MGPETFFVSRERCRLPSSLLLVEAMRRLKGVPCSVSLRAGGRFIISSSQSAGGTLSEDDVVEIADYDPVRHSVLAIGLREPSPDTALHWLAYRTDELAAAAAFVWDFPLRKGVTYVAGRHPWGSFPEAMAIVAAAKRSAGPAGLEGRGYLVKGRSVDELVAAVAGIVKLNSREPQGKKAHPEDLRSSSPRQARLAFGGARRGAQGRAQGARGKGEPAGRRRSGGASESQRRATGTVPREEGR